MRGMTRLAMGAALAVVLSLAMLLALLLFLLLSLFCSLLRSKRHQHNLTQFHDNEIAAVPLDPPRPLSFPFYAHGVLKAPTKYLLSVPNLEAAAAKQAWAPSPSSQSCRHHESGDHFVCISNPIYDRTTTIIAGAADDDDDGGTPFVTPKASPSCFGADEVAETNDQCSPPLKLMKKLPAVQPEASSAACLFDGRRSLGASTETNRLSSSPSSNSLCSSPSW